MECPRFAVVSHKGWLVCWLFTVGFFAFVLKRQGRQRQAARGPPVVRASAPGSALRLLPSRALSSAQVDFSVAPGHAPGKAGQTFRPPPPLSRPAAAQPAVDAR